MAEVLGHADNAALVEPNVFGEHAIDRTAEAGCQIMLAGAACGPALPERSRDPLTHGEARDVFADRDDLAYAV